MKPLSSAYHHFRAAQCGFIIVLLFTLLTGCVHYRQPPPAHQLKVPVSSLSSGKVDDKLPATGRYPDEQQSLPSSEPRPEKPLFLPIKPLRRGDGSSLRPAAGEQEFSKSKMVSVAVDEMPLPDFVHYIFADIFQLNYIIDTKVKKQKEPITLNLSREISEYQLFGVVTEVLKQHRLVVYADAGIYYIGRQAKAGDMAVGIGATLADIPAATGKIKQIIPIKYADARNLLDFLPKDSDLHIIASNQENLLTVTGARERIEQVVRMVEVLDRPAMRGRFAARIQLEYWSPEEMTAKLHDILTQEGIPVTKQPGRKGLYFNNLDRWRSILVFAAEKEWLTRTRYWVKLLDVPRDQDEKRYFLYFPENARAEELGESLEKILGIAKTDAGPAVPIAAPAATAKKAKKSAAGEVGKNLTVTTADVRIAVDENRNALIIYATPKKYQSLRRLLRELDIMPVQVLIEASIAEVTLTGSLQYGLEWYLKNTDGDQTSIIKTLGGLGLGSGGLDASLVTGSQKFKVALNALAQRDMVKILSSPRLMVRDGKSASIVVGTEVPIITSEATSADINVDEGTGIIRSVQYRSTGVSLQLTPSVHARGVITLEITQEVSEAQANTTSNISSPIILNRTITTEVVAEDRQTILLGGMIKENQSNTVTGIPFLSNIPLLGHLFRVDSEGSDRTELIVMITPHIVRTIRQIDETREAIFEKFENLEPVE